MNISILVGTYGGEEWQRLARERALPSAFGQGAREVRSLHQPKGTISSVRNALAEDAADGWLLFLDADDELAPGFVQAMQRTHDSMRDTSRVLFTPAVSYVRNGRRKQPRFWPEIPPQRGNWIVIGTLIERDFFFEVGGFKDYGDPPGSNAFEDWALFARCQQAGAVIVKVPRAVYVAHMDMNSRHRGASRETKAAWHMEIGMDLFPDVYANGIPGQRQTRTLR